MSVALGVEGGPQAERINRMRASKAILEIISELSWELGAFFIGFLMRYSAFPG
jgi:hypothetical protein